MALFIFYRFIKNAGEQEAIRSAISDQPHRRNIILRQALIAAGHDGTTIKRRPCIHIGFIVDRYQTTPVRIIIIPNAIGSGLW